MSANRDTQIDYNDEIVSIEELDELDTIDITVSDDNLFYANNILTKNSMGGPMTFDFLIALISNEELANLNQVMIKQLKNRYADLFNFNKFTLGVDRSKMKFYDLSNSSTTKHSPSANVGTTSKQKQQQSKNGNFTGIKI